MQFSFRFIPRSILNFFFKPLALRNEKSHRRQFVTAIVQQKADNLVLNRRRQGSAASRQYLLVRNVSPVWRC